MTPATFQHRSDTQMATTISAIVRPCEGRTFAPWYQPSELEQLNQGSKRGSPGPSGT